MTNRNKPTASANGDALLPCPCGAPADVEEVPYPVTRSPDLYRMHCIDAQCGWSCVGTSAEDCKTEWNRRNCTIPLAPEYREPTLEDAERVGISIEKSDRSLDELGGIDPDHILRALRAGGFVVRETK